MSFSILVEKTKSELKLGQMGPQDDNFQGVEMHSPVPCVQMLSDL